MKGFNIRVPVILHTESEHYWLKGDTQLSEVTSFLLLYSASLMNAYPVYNQIKSPKAEGRHLVEPIGQRLIKEFDYKRKEDWRLEGMGSKRGHWD